MKKKDPVHEMKHPETVTHGMENKIEKIVEEADKKFGRHS